MDMDDMDLDGDGWRWMEMDGDGWTDMDVAMDVDVDGYGWIWMDMDGHGWIWMDGYEAGWLAGWMDRHLSSGLREHTFPSRRWMH